MGIVSDVPAIFESSRQSEDEPPLRIMLRLGRLVEMLVDQRIQEHERRCHGQDHLDAAMDVSPEFTQVLAAHRKMMHAADQYQTVFNDFLRRNRHC